VSRRTYQVTEITDSGEVIHTHPVWAADMYDALCLYENETGRWVDLKSEQFDFSATEHKLKNGNILSVVAVG
jgi:hypothetical protein